MARGTVKKLPSGKYQARYRPEGSPNQIAKNFDLKKDAERHLDEVNASVLTGQYVDPKSAKTKFRDYAELWFESRIQAQTTEARIRSTLKCHVYPRFGDRPIGSIRRSEVQAWVTDLSKRQKPNTVRNNYGPFSAIMEAATTDRVIGVSPCAGIKMPTRDGAKIEPLSTATVNLVEYKMTKPLKALVVLMAGTGLRPGEASAVTVDRIDFLRRTLKVDRQIMPGYPSRFGPLKTKASYRTVPLPQTVVDVLAAHVAEFGTGPDDVLFVSKRGGYLNRDALRDAFLVAFDRAKAPAGTTPHDLRHYYASLLIHHGENVKVVQARLGHASAKETLDTYSHLWPDTEESTRTAVDGSFGADREDFLRTHQDANTA